MSNRRYILLDSTYRNRNEWPVPGQFEVEVSTSGSRNVRDAQDPLSLAFPVLCWKGNDFDRLNPGDPLKLKLCDDPLLGTSSPITESNSTILLNLCVDGPIGTLHKEQNYYRGAMLVISCTPTDPLPVVTERHRIVEYTFTGNSNYERAFIRLYTPLSQGLYNMLLTSPDQCEITISDPTDVCSTPDNKLLFIPGGIQTTNSYINYILYNETRCNYAYITSTEDVTNITQIDKEKQPDCWHEDPTNPVFIECNTGNAWENTDNYCLRLEAPCMPGKIGYNPNCEATRYAIPITRVTDVDYSCYFLRFKNTEINDVELRGQTRKIKNICCIEPSTENPNPDVIANVCEPFTKVPEQDNDIELLRINRDNEVFYNYSGSWLSQTQESCYEIGLVTLILPNQTLNTGYGSRTAFYPYVILEIENTCGSNSGVKNVVYSNNPNTTKALFIVPITDVNDPLLVPFIHLFGNGVVQTIKFKPNDNLKLTVRLPTGQIFQTILQESYSPASPNPLKQVTAMFSIKKL